MVRKTFFSRRVLAGLGMTACVIVAGIDGRAQRGGGGPAGPQRHSTFQSRSSSATWARRRRAASRRSPACPAIPTTYYARRGVGRRLEDHRRRQTFAPIFDDQPVAGDWRARRRPVATRIVWAGTGEAWAIRDSDVMGDGIYKSTDAGKTWTHMGLGETGRIGRIIIHPTNPDIVFVCAIGRITGPQQERGVFRTTDGGKTWEHVALRGREHRLLRPAMDAKNPNC